MALQAGSRLGAYEIVSRLGAGGMGEVYRGRDPKLGRDVAIKLLPDAFANDPERLARFEREARLLASLQHANIAVLHGLEEAEGRRFLVMQCVEGESLAQRLARGPLPVMDALEVAAAVAAALEAAHDAGIVHRDLKPGNVMVTPTGDVKVLDFGLAKGGAGASSSSDVGLSASPTRTYAGTDAGVILGTAAYMSPEQARGKPVDRRTDIWSFGCVLYECLSGRQAFAGETVSDIVSRILQVEPDWSVLPATTPGRVRDLIARCLQKDARRRLRDIGDARIEIEDLVAGRVSASGAHAATAPATVARPTWRRALPAALVLLTAAATWLVARTLAPGRGTDPVRFAVEAPRGQLFNFSSSISLDISPDGTMLALVASDSSGVNRIWIRRMDALTPRVLPGTEGATISFWSPDSRWIAFFAGDRQLMKVAVAGGDPQSLCEVKNGRGGTWNRDGVILFAPYSNGALYRVSASGGDPAVVLRPDSAHGETGLRFPYFLPDGRHFLYSSLPGDSTGAGRLCVGSLDGGAPRVVAHTETGGIYAPPGWLLYTRLGVPMAQRFDARALKVSGEPHALGDLALGNSFGGSSWLSVSGTGVLAYSTFDPVPTRLAWLDLQGHELPSPPFSSGNYFTPVISPDGHRALVTSADKAQNRFVMLADLDRGILTRLTEPELLAGSPRWSPDGQRFACVEEAIRERIVVRSLADGSQRIYLADDPAFKRPDGWTPDGRFLLYGRLDPATKWDEWVLPLDGGAPRPLLHTTANEQNARLSPDGRWVAFESDESGTQEVYVVPFASPALRYQVTTGGGAVITWTRDSKRLIFVSAKTPNVAMQAEVQPGARFALGAPRVQARLPEQVTNGADLDPSGTRLLAIMPAEAPRPQTVTVVQNWPALLRRN